MRSRRRSGRRRYPQRNRNKLTFAPVIVILCLSVGCGYAAAKYVVDPVVNYVPQFTEEKAAVPDPKETTDKTDVIEDEVEIVDKGKISGYAIQFGCYSGKAAAETVLPTIEVDGLQILEQNDMYKIVGEVYKTKEEARQALENIPDTVNSFVTTIYE